MRFAICKERMANRRRSLAALVRAHPVSFAAFDLLARGGRACGVGPLIARQTQLQLQNATAKWVPPLQLSPMTAAIGPTEAGEVLDVARSSAGKAGTSVFTGPPGTLQSCPQEPSGSPPRCRQCRIRQAEILTSMDF
ncbi:MAG: hypothetical protein JWN61_3300 [Pseudonocardiales bacterium]|nr:hypothetical protein [Pseudonocardiales bacterium]